MKLIEFLKNKLPTEWKTDLDSRSCELFQKQPSKLKATFILSGDAISMLWATLQIVFDDFTSSDESLLDRWVKMFDYMTNFGMINYDQLIIYS